MNRGKVFYVLLLCLCLAGVGVSTVQIVRQLVQYQEGERAYADLAAQVLQPVEELPPLQKPERLEEPEPAAPPWPEVDFPALLEQSPSVVGWLYGPGTQINYPVVQGEDNSYYLTHLYDGTVNSAGSLFLDCQAGALADSLHWVIYGHYMQNGTMFADLLKYKEQEYYDNHPVFLLVTPEARYVVELFSGYVAHVQADAWRMDFSGAEDYGEWLSDRKAASGFQSSVTPTAEDQVITFSTCSYEFSNARFVLHGILREAEKPS